MPYYSGQGRFYVADRNGSGNPGALTALGNVTSLSIDIEVDKFEHSESMTGQRAVDLTIIREKRGTFTMTLEDFNLENLAMGFYGVTADNAGEAITGEIVPITELGKAHRLLWPNVSAVSVHAEGGTPTHVLDTDYTVDLRNGTITPLEGGAIAVDTNVQVDYTYAANTSMNAFTKTSVEKWLRFEGINTVTDNSFVIVDLYKAQFDPLTGYELINEEVGAIELNGTVLLDDLRAEGDQFFRQVNFTTS